MRLRRLILRLVNRFLHGLNHCFGVLFTIIPRANYDRISLSGEMFRSNFCVNRTSTTEKFTIELLTNLRRPLRFYDDVILNYACIQFRKVWAVNTMELYRWKQTISTSFRQQLFIMRMAIFCIRIIISILDSTFAVKVYVGIHHSILICI